MRRVLNGYYTLGKLMVEDKSIADRMKRITELIPQAERRPGNSASVDTLAHNQQQQALYEVCHLAKTILQDTVGERHALWNAFKIDEKYTDPNIVLAAWKTLERLSRQGALRNPALRVAQELEGEILAVADAQVKAAESAPDTPSRQMRLSVAAFLAGAALEDALRRLCDKNSVEYDADRASLAKLQAALYSPTKGAEFISLSDNKAITSWGDTRNKADHGHFDKLGTVEVGLMVVGIRDFIARVLA